MLTLALSFILLVLFFYYKSIVFLLVVGFLLCLFIRNNNKSISFLGLILIVLFASINFTHFNVYRISEGNKYLVKEVKESYYLIEKDKNTYLFYSDNELSKNDYVYIDGDYQYLDKKNDFYKYLRKNNICYLVKGRVYGLEKGESVQNKIINKLISDKKNKDILEMILFNRKSSDNEFYKLFESFSISFMIVISGFHINLLFKLLKKFKVSKYFIILFYLYLLDFLISSVKAYLYVILKKITVRKNLCFSDNDLLSIIMIGFIFINPSYVFNMGFIYSFAFSFAINVINGVFIKDSLKYKFIKKIYIYLVSVPLILLSSYEINSLSLLASLFMSLPISILFVLSLLYLFLDKLYGVYKLYIIFLEFIFYNLKNISTFLVFGKPSYSVIIVLYLFLLLSLYFYKIEYIKRFIITLNLYFITLLFQYCLPILDSKEYVTFLDVGQGDCAILKIRNSKEVALIDTGGNKYKDIATKTIIPYLKKEGINVIDKIIVSHDDFDHNGAKESLIDNFKVNNVIEDSNIKEVIIGSSVFKNLNISDGRENDDSIVLYGEYGGINYLFTGDISEKVEEKIINENEDIFVDVLKVSHHGSKYSTSLEFLKHVNPLIGIISVGENNIYKHPHSEVIDRLIKQNIKIYFTSKDGNIKIYKYINKREILIERE